MLWGALQHECESKVRERIQLVIIERYLLLGSRLRQPDFAGDFSKLLMSLINCEKVKILLVECWIYTQPVVLESCFVRSESNITLHISFWLLTCVDIQCFEGPGSDGIVSFGLAKFDVVLDKFKRNFDIGEICSFFFKSGAFARWFEPLTMLPGNNDDFLNMLVLSAARQLGFGQIDTFVEFRVYDVFLSLTVKFFEVSR